MLITVNNSATVRLTAATLIVLNTRRVGGAYQRIYPAHKKYS